MDEPKSDDEYGQFAVSTDLVQLPHIKQAGYSTIDFDGLLSEPLELLEDLAKGCGGALWPAGIVLAKYVLRRHSETLRDKVILEIGAGGGLVGLGVAKHCDGFKGPVYITDQENMMDLMRHNIEHNDLSAKVEAHIYNWGESRPHTIPANIDIILAADCVYFEPSFPLLLKTLQDLVGPNSICYFCFKKRRRADMNFVKSIKKAFTVSEVEDDPDKDNYKRESIHLLETGFNVGHC